VKYTREAKGLQLLPRCQEMLTAPWPCRTRGTWRRQRASGSPLLLAILLMALLLGGCSANGAGWQASGPQNAHIISLAVTPNEPTKIYAGTASSGVYYSDTAGQSWIGPGKGIPAGTAVSALLPDPGQIGTVYAATSAGVFVSTDSGRTWARASRGLPAGDGTDALVFGLDNRLFVGTEAHGIYVSQDAGKTWVASNSGLPANADVYTLMVDPSNAVLWAGLVGHGVYQSIDDGATWTPVTNGLPASMDVFALLAAPRLTNVLVAGTSLGAFVSTNDGQSWTASNNGLDHTRVLALAGDPLHPGRFYAGTDNGVYETVDSGAHWGKLAYGLPGNEHVAAVVTGDQNYSQVLAAAGQVYRFPGGSSPSGHILTFVIAGILFLALLLLWQRQSKFVKQMSLPTPPPHPSENPLLGQRSARVPPQQSTENPLLQRKTGPPSPDNRSQD
jgi:photosystem II stability/assembly factor-like uncharacterized protein